MRPGRSTVGRTPGGSITSGASSAARPGQYDPVITQDNTTLGVPEGEDGKQYYLPDDLTDQAASWLHTVRAQDQTKPWFIYYSTGCAHAPHQVARRVEREVPRQVRPGLGRAARGDLRTAEAARRDPAGRRSSRRDRTRSRPGTRSRRARRSSTPGRWRSTRASRRTPTGTSAGCSTRSRRWASSTTRSCIYIFGDNGASLEGTITGSFNELTMQNGIALTPEQQLSLIDQYGGLDAWGTDAFAPHYATAWAWAGNTPFQWGKQVASHLGGTRNGMVVSWPERIKDAGGLRSQFTHCIDIGADDPRGGRHPGAQGRGRDRAEANGGDELPLQLRRRERGRAPHRAVLRDLRQPGDLQGRLVGRLHARPHPLGRVAAVDRRVRARRLRPGAGHVGAVLPARRLRAGEGRRCGKPREARRAEGALLAGGREAQRPAATGRILGLLRDPAADAHRHDAHVLRRRPEHRLRDDPPHLRSLVRDRGGAVHTGAAVPRA